MAIDFRCQVCDRDFDRVRLPGNHLQRRRVCEPCREWHTWCNKCGRAKLHSEFDRHSATKNGLQSRCRDCRIDGQGLIKVRLCGHCIHEFIVSEHRSYNGLNEWICEGCRIDVKRCNRCDTYKPVGEFSKRRDASVGRVAHCRTCMATAWSASDHARRTQSKRRQFGLSYDEYLSMCIAQGNKCRICDKPESEVHSTGRIRELAIDHDHRTGKVRGLLCGKCNRAIGLMLDSPEILRAAASYLESTRIEIAEGVR